MPVIVRIAVRRSSEVCVLNALSNDKVSWSRNWKRGWGVTFSHGSDAMTDRSCCSFQSGLTPPEHRKWRRIHGLQLPFHPQQVAGWIVLVVFVCSTFFVLVPALEKRIQSVLFAVFVGLFLLHAISHLTALLLDPADYPLRKLKSTTAVPEFDRTKHAHVIENGRCHLCNIETSGPQTKHCSVCNKCVGKFDHHCKWLNHCIGARNYVAFLVCVVSAVVSCLIIVGISVAELVLYHVDQSWLNLPNRNHFDNTTSDLSDFEHLVHDQVFLFIVASVGILAAIAAGLLLHLCLFHVYISILGITTYEYIRNYRQLSASRNIPSTSRRESGPNKTLVTRTQSMHSSSSVHSFNESDSRNKRAVSKCTNRDPISNKNIDENDSSRSRSNNSDSASMHNCFSKLDIFRRNMNDIEDGNHAGSCSSSRSFYKQNSAEIRDDLNRRICCTYKCSNCTSTGISVERKSGNTKFKDRGISKRFCWRPRRRTQRENSQTDVRKRSEMFRCLLPTCVMCSLFTRAMPSNEQNGGVSPAVRRNQVKPVVEVSKNVQTVSFVGEISAVETASDKPNRSASVSALPALPPPTRRQIHSVSLKELGDVLAFVQQPRRPMQPLRRHYRRRSIPQLRPTMSPTLSPIHESGLSNPSTPHMNEKLSRSKQGVWLAVDSHI